jgi:hypothetical protein
MVAHVCNPRYAGSRDRKISAQGQSEKLTRLKNKPGVIVHTLVPTVWEEAMGW